MDRSLIGVFLFAVITSHALAKLGLSDCEVAAKIDSGYICGRLRKAANGDDYASFRGIPYAKQPLGELRFKELQPADPFDGPFNATEHGPVCPQVDVIYGPIMQPLAMSEDCIRINVHLPKTALPDLKVTEKSNKTLLPILMFVHGGSFSFGSGDTDLQGPEYIVTKGVILVTFNYRLNVPGFFSLGSKDIPGNNGLRDVITALRWLQRNAKAFGGDPDEVTLGGQSAGATMVHLVSLSPAVEGQGLFKRVMSLSGTAIANIYSPSPLFAKFLGAIFLIFLGINPLSTSAIIHKQLVDMPIERLIKANKAILDTSALISFAPVIETPLTNITTIIPKDPEQMLNEGKGKDYPLLLGFTNRESQTFAKRVEEVNLVEKVLTGPLLVSLVPSNIAVVNILLVPLLTAKIVKQYFNGTVNLPRYLNFWTDSFYKYPLFRAVKKRLAVDAAPMYIYEFAYPGNQSVIKIAQNRTFSGAGHIEDMTYFFRVNSILGQLTTNELQMKDDDSQMRDWMTSIVSDFVKNRQPGEEGCSLWNATGRQLQYQRIRKPMERALRPPSRLLNRMKDFFESLYSLVFGQ